MTDLTIILNDSPYGSDKPWNGLRLTSTSVSQEIGMEVKVFLMGDSVLAAKRGQSTPEGYYNIEKMIGSLAQRGVEFKACGSCLDARGLGADDLAEGVERGSMRILAGWIKESRNVVSF
ncbi:MAG: DsrE family protein [Candidatus Bathyarchaeota archaeon]|nr:MAG: DsrE family protein [Candidatus Bathyarchaeota archaeon]